MPRGMHPNSRKALEENRHKGQFTGAERPVEERVKANKTRARNKSFKEEFQLELATLVSDGTGSKTTVKNAITKMAVQKALRGDMRALEFIRDTIGEKPIETLEVRQADFSALDKLRAELEHDSP